MTFLRRRSGSLSEEPEQSFAQRHECVRTGGGAGGFFHEFEILINMFIRAEHDIILMNKIH